MSIMPDKELTTQIIRWVTIGLAILSITAAVFAIVELQPDNMFDKLHEAANDHRQNLNLSILFLWISLILRALRWPKIHGVMERRREQVAGYLWAFNLGVFAPFRLGDVFFVTWFKTRGFSGLKAGLGLAAERAVDLLALGMIAFFVSLQLPGLFNLGEISYPTYLIWLHVLIAAVLVLYFWIIPKPFRSRLNREITNTFQRFRKTPSIFIYTILIWIARGMSVWFILSICGITPDLAVAFAILVGVNFAAALLPTPGAIGSFEAAMAGVLVAQGLSIEDALLFAVFYHFIVYAAGLVLALVGRIVLLYRSGLSRAGD